MDFQLAFDRLNVNLDDSEVERQWKLINVFSCKLIIIISIEIASFIINYCMNNGFKLLCFRSPGPIGPAGIPGHDGRPGVQGEAGVRGEPG